MVFSEQLDMVVSVVTGDGYFKMVDFKKSQEIVNIKAHQGIANSLSCNHQLPFLFLTSGDDGVLNLIDIQNQKIDRVDVFPKEKAINCLSWSPKNKSVFATGSNNGELNIYDLNSQDRRSVLNIQQDAILSLDFNKYNPEIVTGSSDNTIRVFDLRNPQIPIYILTGHRYGVNKVQCSPFDKFDLISCSFDMTVKSWSFQNMQQPLLRSHEKHREFIYDIDYSLFIKDMILTGSIDKTFCIFNSKNEQPYYFNQLFTLRFSSVIALSFWID